MEYQGRPFQGHLNSEDASGGVTVAITEHGAPAAYTLKAHEYLEVHDIQLVTETGGDCRVIFTDSPSGTTGTTVVRGNYAANGGVSARFKIPVVGARGEFLRAVAPAGDLDVVVRGTIRNDTTQGVRPNYRDDLNPS